MGYWQLIFYNLNLTLGFNQSLLYSIDFGLGEGGNSVEEESSIPLGHQDPEPLEEVTDGVILVLPGVPGQGSTNLLNVDLRNVEWVEKSAFILLYGER